MTKRLSLIIFMALALVAGGCRDWFPPLDPTDPKDPNDPPLITDFRNVRWCLESIQEKNSITPVDPNLDMHVIFGDNNQMSGFGGCNGFGGEYKAPPGAARLQIDNLWSTDMYCDAAGRYENLFFEALTKAESYTINGDGSRFSIVYDNGNLLNFRSCGTPDPTDPPADTMMTEIKIPYGTTGDAWNGLSITFEKILEDSRCPIDMACIDAGNAKIGIVASEGGVSERFELNTTRGEKSATFRDYTIELTYLHPDPRGNEQIPINGYMAVLRVTKH